MVNGLAGNVLNMNDYRARRLARRFPERYPLGALVRYDGQLFTVVGTWMFNGARGLPGTVETRDRRVDQDPREDQSAHGYLLQPTEGTGFSFVPFGAVATGDLVRLF